MCKIKLKVQQKAFNIEEDDSKFPGTISYSLSPITDLYALIEVANKASIKKYIRVESIKDLDPYHSGERTYDLVIKSNIKKSYAIRILLEIFDASVVFKRGFKILELQ